MTPEDRMKYTLLLTDEQVLALTAYGEARGESVMGLVAVMAVIKNRAAIKKTNVRLEAFRKAAFECWLDEKGTNDDMLAQMAAKVVAGEPIGHDPVWDVCAYLAERKDLRDPTGGATHYLNPKAVAALPAWTRPPAVLAATIGRHSFYRNVAF